MLALRLWFAGLLVPAIAFAHGLDPAALGLREFRPGVFAVTWQVSALRVPGANVQPVLPSVCHRVGDGEVRNGAGRVTLRWTVDCGPGGLAGATIRVDDLAAAQISALVRIERLDTPEILTVLSPRRPSFTVPPRARWWEVVDGYARLGVEHILTGPDHLLFVFGLLLLVPARRALVQTITAFTLGHSVTLSAAALQLTTVPSRLMEVLIALSVLVLAVELAGEGGEAAWLRRRPWAMAGAFGLLHGFGFAGALAEAGLPAGDVPLALVSFNAGIEVGQLVFVAVVLAARAGAARGFSRAVTRSARPATYAMGCLAAFWCFERVAIWLG
jgi:hydrogenase/urease accessory protein HupE